MARRRRQTSRTTDDLPRELSFEDDGPVGRIGDPVPEGDEFPARRVREAGLTGASVRDSGVTADDLSPETLLDDAPSRTPSAHLEREPLDAMLRKVDEAEIGEGDGLDEAEEARQHPISAEEHAERKRQAARPRGPRT